MTRLDPYAAADAIARGRQSANQTFGLVLSAQEQQRRVERDQAIAALEQEEAQIRRTLFEQQQTAAQAAQEFQAAEYENLIGRPAFNQATDAMMAGDQSGMASGMTGMAAAQQQRPLFAALPPALQQHYLEPLRKEADVRQRRQGVEKWADENFATQPDMRYAVLEDWDARNLFNLPEGTIQEIRNSRPLNVERFRSQLTGLGLQPDQINELLAASFAGQAGVPAGAITQTLRPDKQAFDPAEYGQRLVQGGIPEESAAILQRVATVIGKEPPASLAIKVMQPGGADPEAVFQDLVAMYPQGDQGRLRAVANMLSRGMSVDRPEVSISGRETATSFKSDPDFILLERAEKRATEAYDDALSAFERVDADLAKFPKPNAQQQERLRAAQANLRMARMNRDKAQQDADAFIQSRQAPPTPATAPAAAPTTPSPRGATAVGAAPPSSAPAAPMQAPGAAPGVPAVPRPEKVQAAMRAKEQAERELQAEGIEPTPDAIKARMIRILSGEAGG